MAARAAVSSVTINKLLGYVTYLLDDASSKIIEAPAIDSTRPAWMANRDTQPHPAGVASRDGRAWLRLLRSQHAYTLPSVERSYLADLRSAFEESNVEIFQLLIDTGEVGSPGSSKNGSAGIDHTKFWMEVAAELGASGVRYVPGDSEPTPETIRKTAVAFRELYDFAVGHGLKPATENYRIFTNEADDLLQLVELSERDYGWIADTGNPKGPEKYNNLAKLLAWRDLDARLGAAQLKTARLTKRSFGIV